MPFPFSPSRASCPLLTSTGTHAQFFRKLHGLYIDQVCSPFYIINTAIESKRFDAAVTSLVNSF